MKIAIIVGSSRQDSQSCKVANFINETIKLNICDACSEVVYAMNVMPHCWEILSADNNQLLHNKTLEILKECTAVILVAPEWGGMAPPALKNLLLACDRHLAHKPGLLIGISSGLGGSYPVMELRASGYKNSKICYLPEHLIIRNVEMVLNQDKPSDEADERIRKRLLYTLQLLCLYGSSMQAIRASNAIDLFRYPYGM